MGHLALQPLRYQQCDTEEYSQMGVNTGRGDTRDEILGGVYKYS